MNLLFKRIVSTILSVTLLLTSIPLTAFAEDGDDQDAVYRPTDKSIILNADSDSEITIKQPETTDPDTPDTPPTIGLTAIYANEYNIDRDYEQQCLLTVENLSSEPQTVYLEAKNDYADISLEIIKAGSKGNPVILAPGESRQVELSVFAQNAARTEYFIPVTGYVLSGDSFVEDSRVTAEINCTLPNLQLSWELLSEESSTLTQKYRLTNTGDPLTDLTISAGNGLENYVSFSPIYANYSLSAGESIEFSASPDLAKMKNNNVASIDGVLIAECAGENSTKSAKFDTNGQDITITTMGELARKQNGDVFTEFEIIEDSVKIEHFDGSNYVDVDNSNASQLLDEDDMFNVRVDADVDLGVGEPLSTQLTFRSELITDPNVVVDETPQIIETADGNAQMRVRLVITRSEYDEILSSYFGKESSGSNKSIATEPSDETSRVLLDIIFELRDIVDFFTKLELEGLGALGDIYDFISELEAMLLVADDPNVDSDTKTTYVICTICEWVMTAGSKILGKLGGPIAKIVFDFLSGLLDHLMDDYKKILLKDAEKNAAILNEIEGKQCTNRGHSSAKFYVPSYKLNNGKKPDVIATSRMYGDGYVDKTETNYDISLNGEKVGTVSNAGLTEVTITEIPNDKIKMGEVNEVKFDYDTNPGSHFVTADTTITLIYPEDTEIGFIGSPDELRDVRSLPDATIYSENIFIDGDLIEGETATLTFNAYNLGSHEGWFTVVASENGKEIFKEENVHFEPFTLKVFSIDWIPSAGTNAITVSVTNASDRLNEYDDTNNTATTSFTVRSREEPEIGELDYNTLYANRPYKMTLDVENVKDISDVSIKIDGSEIDGSVSVSKDDNANRYLITGNSALPIGTHSLEINVEYATKDGKKNVTKSFSIEVKDNYYVVPYELVDSTTLLCDDTFDFSVYDIDNLISTSIVLDSGSASVLSPDYSSSWSHGYSVDVSSLSVGTHTAKIEVKYGDTNSPLSVVSNYDFTILSESDSYFKFTLSEDITSPEFYLISDEYQASCTVTEQSDGSYLLKKNAYVRDHLSDLSFVIKYDNGIIVDDISEGVKSFDTKNQHTLTINSGSTGSLQGISVESINGIYFYDYFDGTDSLQLSPGIYEVYLSASVDGNSFSRSLSIDVTASNQTINLIDLVTVHYFKLEGFEGNYYDAEIYYHNSEDDYWSSRYMSTRYDSESGILGCYVTSASAVNNINNSDEVFIVIYSSSEAFVVNIKEAAPALLMLALSDLPEDIKTIKRSDLNKVTLKCEDPTLSVERIQISWDSFSLWLYGDVISIPDGNYNLTAALSDGKQYLHSTVDSNVTADCDVIVDSNLTDATSVTFKWATQFSKSANIGYSSSFGSYYYMNDVSNGDSFLVENGRRYFDIALTQDDTQFNIERSADINDENKSITVDNTFDGIIEQMPSDVYDPGSTVEIYLNELADKNGNIMYSYYAETAPLIGYAYFTNTADETEIITIPVTSTTKSIQLQLPEKPGTYKLSVTVFTYGLLDEDDQNQEHTHTEVIDPARRATCTRSGLTQGSHCSECGEVIKKQSVIPATGHNYTSPDFTWDGSSKCVAVFSCSNCWHTVSKDCEITTTTDASGKTTYTATITFNGRTYSDIFAASVTPTPTPPEVLAASAERLSGDTRYETAIDISNEGWSKADTVILACGENYPDALAGTALSKAYNAPILLTKKDTLDAKVLAELQRLGAKNVIILGGTAAVSQQIEDNLARSYSVTRLGGANRNGTAAMVAAKLTAKSDVAFLVSNKTYADALSAGSAAALMGAPILYVNPDGTIPAETAEALKTLGCSKVYIIGGTAAVDASAESNIKSLGMTAERVYGNDRYLTSIAVYNKFEHLFTSDDAAIATGKNYPDALSGVAFAAKNGMPVFLVGDAAPAILVAKFDSMDINTLYVFGGVNAVSEAVVNALTK